MNKISLTEFKKCSLTDMLDIMKNPLNPTGQLEVYKAGKLYFTFTYKGLLSEGKNALYLSRYQTGQFTGKKVIVNSEEDGVYFIHLSQNYGREVLGSSIAVIEKRFEPTMGNLSL